MSRVRITMYALLAGVALFLVSLVVLPAIAVEGVAPLLQPSPRPTSALPTLRPTIVLPTPVTPTPVTPTHVAPTATTPSKPAPEYAEPASPTPTPSTPFLPETGDPAKHGWVLGLAIGCFVLGIDLLLLGWARTRVGLQVSRQGRHSDFPDRDE